MSTVTVSIIIGFVSLFISGLTLGFALSSRSAAGIIHDSQCVGCPRASSDRYDPSDGGEMTPEETATAMHGLATNPNVLLENRLACALQVLDYYIEEEHRSRVRTIGEKVAATQGHVLEQLRDN